MPSTLVKTNKSTVFSLYVVPLIALIIALAQPASAEVKLLRGQTVYVPAYSHIYHGDREVPFYLTVTLSVRNTDPEHPISITAVEYHDNDGKLLTNYLKAAVKLAPMGSIHYIVKESDRSGGAGANFIVRWRSESKVTEPLIESVMISTATQQGISFTSRGQAVRDEP
ncbi:DUF3124 domain-containing protein [Syntrophobacter fumaroxidans]|nr:DUF3124 domain-containing protein [Syntrophobacter fumaroxidans]